MMNPKETAIVAIEFQNEFCSEDGKLHALVREVLEKNRTLANTERLLQKARGKALIIYVPITFEPSFPELKEPVGVLKSVKDSGSFQKGKKGAELYAPLAPQPGDIVIEGKRGLCGFASTNMDFILRNHGIKNVAICGFLTNICVESTVRTAYELGYRVFVLRDCTAATSMEEQRFAEEKIFPAFGTVMTHEEFLKQLESSAIASS